MKKLTLVKILLFVCVVGVFAFAFVSNYFYQRNKPERMANYIASTQKTEEPSAVAKLQINRGWTFDIEDDWCYVRGSVKNIGDIPLDYFEVHAEYLDANGNILDTDWTNSGELIKVGSQKKFEIMHEYDPEFKKVSVTVTWYD